MPNLDQTIVDEQTMEEPDQTTNEAQMNPDAQTIQEEHIQFEPKRSTRTKLPFSNYPPDEYVTLTEVLEM
ncbi:unnamed protein product [Sphenostylis stenocarpa]|uniref:Uncharacterized protein n=1 Tax=Sphenostylis stenocarpa TaxID=92480 RepID=A0AA86VCQ5_9FABA|nr:unnamed protein product [Sphenostylis stenocarpa]